MPALTDSPNDCKVLVTGSNGFVGTHIVGDLLKKGYSVRATVRTEAKGTHLVDIFGKSFGDKFEMVVIGDMMNVRCLLMTTMLMLRRIGRSF